MKAFVTGHKERFEELNSRLHSKLEFFYEKENEEQDLNGYDIFFDLNADEEIKSLMRYKVLKDKPVFVSAAKKQLAEMVQEIGSDISFHLFGFNALKTFISNEKWEISIFSKVSSAYLSDITSKLELDYLEVNDRVGLVKPRVIFMIINEACYTVQEGTAEMKDIDNSMKLGTNYPFGPFEWADKVGIVDVYETLEVIFKDTGDERYKVCPLLKTKYLKGEAFYS